MAREITRLSSADQASTLRELARRERSEAVTIAVMSGKGGVGKSNIAVNLSICLSSEQWRVVLVDADMGLANADLLMGLAPRYTMSHVISGVRSVEEVCVEGPGGVRFVPGVSGLSELADLSEFERRSLIAQLRTLERSADIVVLDCGAGISRNVISFALAADRVIVVTTPEPTAMTDAYATVKTLHNECCRAPIGLFVNMADGRADAMDAYHRVTRVARRFLNYTIADDGYMLQDRAVELAVEARCPFVIRYPGSNASACIAAMARKLTRALTGQRHRGGFFSRVAGMFV
jgi:flagellar biosynthesis protein FlhG